MKTGMKFYAGECGYLSLLSERSYWRLNNYWIPILCKDEIESASEELLLKYCPKALEDISEYSAFVLTQRMGLRVEWLPLYKKSTHTQRDLLLPRNRHGTAGTDRGTIRICIP